MEENSSSLVVGASDIGIKVERHFRTVDLSFGYARPDGEFQRCGYAATMFPDQLDDLIAALIKMKGEMNEPTVGR